MLDQVKTVTSKPVTHIICTHAHADHAGGSSRAPADVQVLAQENTGRRLAAFERTLDSRNERAHPARTFRDRLTIFDGQDAIDLYYFGPAHTDGDTFVVFRAAGVMHAGDVFPERSAPNINTEWGGSGLAYGATIAKAAAGISGVGLVITGHGPVYAWDDFVDFGEYMEILLEQSRAALRSGKRPFQVVAELKLPAKFKDYKPGRVGDTIVEIYRGLTPWWQFWK